MMGPLIGPFKRLYFKSSNYLKIGIDVKKAKNLGSDATAA